MLTMTYSLVAMTIEQKNTRKMLLELEQKIKNNNWNDTKNCDLSYIKMILNKFIQFDKYFHSRKVEIYVIPAIRKTTEKIDCLLAELESLSSQAINSIRLMYEKTQRTISKEGIKTDVLFSSMEHYCQSLLKRLIKEEEQLFPVVRCLLTSEEWFTIAVECMSDNKNQDIHPARHVSDE